MVGSGYMQGSLTTSKVIKQRENCIDPLEEKNEFLEKKPNELKLFDEIKILKSELKFVNTISIY
jgi:hypothetical protein